jgi:hypothetical protein
MKILHLSVAADGVISLWDSAQQAKATTGEIYIALQLTKLQEATVKQAAQRATHNNRDGQRVR